MRRALTVFSSTGSVLLISGSAQYLPDSALLLVHVDAGLPHDREAGGMEFPRHRAFVELFQDVEVKQCTRSR